MESWERVFWSARPALPSRVSLPRIRYALTDFRIIATRGGSPLHEIALDDISDVRLEQRWWQRIAGTSTVRIEARRPGRSLALRDVRHGPQLTLILQLLANSRLSGTLDPDFVQEALGSNAPRLLHPNHALMAAAIALSLLACILTGASRHSTLLPITYAPDDPIAPGGNRRPVPDIVAFMVSDVMPFARRALGPVVGGEDHVTCETCHGHEAAAREWRMPGVRALPEPEVRFARMEQVGFLLDPQVRNAVYGYLAEEDKLPTAAYMRGVVMPGMAAVLHRPPYDFTKSYGYNRSRVAVGCYHCHLVN